VVGEPLTGQVAERQPTSSFTPGADDRLEQREQFPVLEAPLELGDEDFVLDTREKGADVGLQAAGMPSREATGAPQGAVGSLADPTAVGVEIEPALEVGLDDADHGVMDDAIAERRHRNLTFLRVEDTEGDRNAWAPRPTGERSAVTGQRSPVTGG
jgi:hypothetical protein